MKKDIRKLGLPELKDYVSETGLPVFRAKQIWEWIWVKSAHTFEEMSNLSLLMRAQLTKDFDILPISVQTDQKSNDGTIKLAFALHDKALVEGVLIPADDRMTACVSSQVGCSLSCKFCATGYMDRKRNLDPAEIYDQVVEIESTGTASFEDVKDLVAGQRGRVVFEEGQMEHGIWSAGISVARVKDIPTCDEMVSRLVSGAEDIIDGRLQQIKA